MSNVLVQSPSATVHSPREGLSPQNFVRIAKLVEDKSGIKLTKSKMVMIEGRLRKRMQANGLNSFSDYCDLLFSDERPEDEIEKLIDSMTTNKTDFFREPEHFDFLRNEALPELIASRRKLAPNPLIKLWSAASSTGAEAFTLAMVLHEQWELRHDFRFAILGTDISMSVLEQAQRAVFPAEMMNPVPQELLKRYVMQSRRPTLQKEVRMAPVLRRHVQFQYLNLIDKSYTVDRDVDAIFLRNVLIYFQKDEQEAVVRRLYGHLRKGGFLFLGHSESMVGSNLGYRQVARAVYQRT